LSAAPSPDLLLLDLGMPVLDGFCVIRKIRDDPRWAKLPVLAVSAYPMHGDRDKIMNSGFDGYLSKPINSVLLPEGLTRLLNKKEPQEAIKPVAIE
jgi:CheY-like chemotaxis protein